MPAYDIDDLLKEAVGKRASDIHLSCGLPPVYRVDGRLIATEYDRLAPKDTQLLVYSMLTDKQKQRFEENFELDLSYGVQGAGRFRVNVFLQRGVVGCVMRAIPSKIPTLKELGTPTILAELTKKPRGLILVTGPTGSGKSTTIAAMIDQINTSRDAHIMTIEDPIEYLHRHKKSLINQRELLLDTLSFKAALRSALREDPDVILVGEMRDLETIEAAITIAETGHLVFATLHTNSCSGAVDRMVDVFPPHQQTQIRTMLSNNLEAIVAQQLIPKSQGKGRVPAVEIMICTSGIRNLIREAKAHQIDAAIQTGAKEGMQTMDMALRDLYLAGQVSLAEARKRTFNPEEFEKLVQGR